MPKQALPATVPEELEGTDPGTPSSAGTLKTVARMAFHAVTVRLGMFMHEVDAHLCLCHVHCQAWLVGAAMHTFEHYQFIWDTQNVRFVLAACSNPLLGKPTSYCSFEQFALSNACEQGSHSQSWTDMLVDIKLIHCLAPLVF